MRQNEPLDLSGAIVTGGYVTRDLAPSLLFQLIQTESDEIIVCHVDDLQVGEKLVQFPAGHLNRG